MSNAPDLPPPLHRSPLEAWAEALGAGFGVHADARVVETLPGAGDRAAEAPYLVDLTPLPRAGLKGADTADWLAERGLPFEVEPNHARRATPPGESADLVLARLGPGEALVLPATATGAWTDWPARALADHPPGARLVFPVPRRDGSFWFRLMGAEAGTVLATLCAVDLSPDALGPLDLAQTIVAEISMIVIRDDLVVTGDGGGKEARLGYHLLGDRASAAYAWEAVLQALAGFGGAPAGLREGALGL